MKKGVHSNAKILSSLFGHLTRLSDEIFDDIAQDETVKAVFWVDEKAPTKHIGMMQLRDGRIVVSFKKEPRPNGAVIMAGIWDPASKKQFNVNDADMVPVKDFDPFERAKIAIRLTEIFKDKDWLE